VILKSFLVERNLSLIDGYSSILFYGENIGLKDEIKSEIKKKYNKYEQISFSQEEIIKNKNLLDEQINNVSLFNNKKIIFISEVSDKVKSKIFEIVKNLNDHIKIFIFSQNLEKKSEIRSLFEKNKKIAIIPCYQDNHRTLSEYLQKKLKDYKGMNQEIINFLIDNSGLDRKVLSNEVEKIKSLFINKKIDQEKTINLLNNAYNLDFNNLRDSCFEGNKEKLNINLGNVILQNEDVYFYLNNLNLRIQKLLQLENQYKKDKNIELAIDNLTPRVFWKDKPIILRQIKKWNLEKLEKAKKYIIDAEIKMKTKMNNYNAIIIKNLLIKLYRLANSTS
tara:strand:+ start:847 stop:1851 length:1005 start_codon:yes stop_codon:yes gene_type:complete